jgi:predicted metal-binding membrane protein
VLEGDRHALIALLLSLAGIGWVVTWTRMRGMDAGPGTDPGALGFYIRVWVVMMAAMMFPSIAPMVLMYVRVHRRRRELGHRAPVGSIAFFVAGYLATWSAAGVLAFVIVKVARSASIEELSWSRGGPYAAGAVIAAAAVYQLTPLKDTCLVHCRSPLMFVIEHWSDGRAGALRMGIIHGAWCVGCCWALMAALFALGVMSLVWMALVAGLIAVEKLLPWKAVANRGVAVALLVLSLAIALAPDRVPGLTEPHSGMKDSGMKDSGMKDSGMKDSGMKDSGMKDSGMKSR